MRCKINFDWMNWKFEEVKCTVYLLESVFSCAVSNDIFDKIKSKWKICFNCCIWWRINVLYLNLRSHRQISDFVAILTCHRQNSTYDSKITNWPC
jgi:hypothetical protein